MNGNNGFGGAAIILALGLGIALMIFAAQPRARGAELVTAAVTWQAVMTNENSHVKHPWSKRTWPSEDQCTKALGNLNDALRAVAGAGDMPDHFTGTDPEVVESADAVVNYIYQNTGALPNLSIACEPKGDPA